MTDRTANLIEALSQNAAPARVSSPLGIFLRWILASAVYTGILVLISGIRPDLQQELKSPLFLSQLAWLVGMIITSGMAAALLSYPDVYQKKWIVFTPLVPLIGFTVTLYVAWTKQAPDLAAPEHGIECLLCITLFSLFSAVWLMSVLRKQAVTHYYLAGCLSLVAASSIGAATFMFCEPTDSVTHLVLWHYLPIIGFGLIGLIFGRKLLRW